MDTYHIVTVSSQAHFINMDGVADLVFIKHYIDEKTDLSMSSLQLFPPYIPANSNNSYAFEWYNHYAFNLDYYIKLYAKLVCLIMSFMLTEIRYFGLVLDWQMCNKFMDLLPDR